MHPADLLKRLGDQPFKPFRVHLTDGTRLDVSEPSMVIAGRSTAVLPSQFERDEDGYRIARNWRTVSLIHVVQLSDLAEKSNGRRRRRK